jgi:Leucine-rich repeat (LRR) protein
MNDSLDIIAQMTGLKELRLADNALSGELSSGISELRDLEVLEVQGNKLSSLPDEIGALMHLRVLNVASNQLTDLPMPELGKCSLTQILASKNHISGTLFSASATSMPRLQELDVSVNSITTLAEAALALPVLHTLNISFNRIDALPDLSSWTALVNILAEDNKISELPAGFVTSTTLRSVDFTGNDFSRLDSEIGRMTGLESLKIAANPIRERKFMTMSIADLKRDLKARLGPDVPGDELD